MDVQSGKETAVTMLKKYKVIVIIAAVVVGFWFVFNVLLPFIFSIVDPPDPNELRMNRTYVLKAADGSGEVPVYDYNGNMSTVPDGTEMVVERYMSSDPPRAAIKIGESQLVVERQHVAGEAQASIDARESRNKTARRNEFIEYSLQALVFAAAIFGYFFLKLLVKKTFAAYYSGKRKQFPWLEKWIALNVDPEPLRVLERTKIMKIIVIVAVIVGFILGYLFSMFPRKAERIDRILIKIITQAIFVGISLVVSFLLTRKTPRNITFAAVPLECPHCGCPHARGMTSSNIIVDEFDKSIHTNTTTTTTTTKWKGTPDAVDYVLSGFNSGGTKVKTKTDTTIDIKIKGTEIEDYFCENCGKAEHIESAYDYRGPTTGHIGRANDFYFDWKDGIAPTSFAKDFLERVKKNSKLADIPSSVIKELQEQTDEFTGTYESLGSIDQDIAIQYYWSFVREITYEYLKDLPDEKRALFGMMPKWTLYAWTPPVKPVKKEQATA